MFPVLGGSPLTRLRCRRRQGQVDYAALNLRMEEEAQAARREGQLASLKHLPGASVSSSRAVNGV